MLEGMVTAYVCQRDALANDRSHQEVYWIRS